MISAVFAFVGAIAAAFTSSKDSGCWYSQQYVKVGINYVAVGEFGVDYDCWITAGTCTYYKPFPVTQPNRYDPCHQGTYTVIPE